MTQIKPVRPERPPEDKSFNARFSRGLSRLLARLKVEEVPHIKRIIVTVVGGTILILGSALVFLPIPGSGPVVILGGLAILGTEYAWARRWLRKGKMMANKALSQTQKILAPKEKDTYRALEASLRRRWAWRSLLGTRSNDAYQTQESSLQPEPPVAKVPGAEPGLDATR